MPSTLSKRDTRAVISEAARMCFAISACALVAAIMGVVVNSYLSGWLAVLGMITIALLYLGLGISQLRVEGPETIQIGDRPEKSFELRNSASGERDTAPMTHHDHRPAPPTGSAPR